jgi:hypothetical protein
MRESDKFVFVVVLIISILVWYPAMPCTTVGIVIGLMIVLYHLYKPRHRR